MTRKKTVMEKSTPAKKAKAIAPSKKKLPVYPPQTREKKEKPEQPKDLGRLMGEVEKSNPSFIEWLRKRKPRK